MVASCWIFLYELCYDARIHEHKVLLVCDGIYPGAPQSNVNGMLDNPPAYRVTCCFYHQSRSISIAEETV
jgi:hypothetical protein